MPPVEIHWSVSGRTKIFQGIVINVGRIVGAVALSVVIACKGTALLIEQHREQTAVQLIPDKLPQIHIGRISLTCLVTSLYSFKKSSPIRSCSIHQRR